MFTIFLVCFFIVVMLGISITLSNNDKEVSSSNKESKILTKQLAAAEKQNAELLAENAKLAGYVKALETVIEWPTALNVVAQHEIMQKVLLEFEKEQDAEKE